MPNHHQSKLESDTTSSISRALPPQLRFMHHGKRFLLGFLGKPAKICTDVKVILRISQSIFICRQAPTDAIGPFNELVCMYILSFHLSLDRQIFFLPNGRCTHLPIYHSKPVKSYIYQCTNILFVYIIRLPSFSLLFSNIMLFSEDISCVKWGVYFHFSSSLYE